MIIRSDRALDGKPLFARPALYAEFEPLESHGDLVASIYILKDRGLLTGSRQTFASPFKEIVFTFRESAGGTGAVLLSEPRFGNREKGRAFFGWMIGIKFKPNYAVSLTIEDPMIVVFQSELASAINKNLAYLDILDAVDRFLLNLLRQAEGWQVDCSNCFEASYSRVAELADGLGRSVRSVQ